ncbi:MAG: prolyl-tRNA synthetase associated domain-containing protein [Promethearchaeota archaeon]
MKESLKNWLSSHNIQYILHQHLAVFTVPEAKIHCGHIEGIHCKNLFLKNKKTSQFYLVTIPYDKRLDLNGFRRMIGVPKIRFAEPEDLLDVLGITPGAVSPIGLVNDIENRTIFIIDEEVWNADEICCHPNINSETMQIPGSEFQKLIEATGNTLEIKELPYSEPLPEEG